jgi:hypothetical protein
MVTLVFILVVLLVLAIATERYASPPNDNELKLGKAGYFLAWVALLMCFIPIYQLAFGKNDGDTWFGLFTLTPAGLWGFLYFLTVKFKFDENGIEVKSLVTMGNAGSWKHFQSIWFSPKSYSYVMEFSYGNIHIYTMLRNKSHLLEFLEKKGIEIE